ncbi:MAG: hypothetical protein P9M08_07560 [Candidatus Erginobacter occultus]|nr:hypothetical protein [Candidatus Erginobacter occultus]
MPKIMINLNANEISRVIDQLSQRETTVLIRKLEKETWAVRFNHLLEKVRLKAKDFPVSEEEICYEVEKSRRKNYAQGSR